MAFSFSDLLPDSAREKWNASKNKYRLDPTSQPKTLVDLLYGSVEAAQNKIREGTIAAGLATGEGRIAQQEATRQTVAGYLANPVLWIIGVVIILFFVKRR